MSRSNGPLQDHSSVSGDATLEKGDAPPQHENETKTSIQEAASLKADFLLLAYSKNGRVAPANDLVWDFMKFLCK